MFTDPKYIVHFTLQAFRKEESIEKIETIQTSKYNKYVFYLFTYLAIYLHVHQSKI